MDDETDAYVAYQQQFTMLSESKKQKLRKKTTDAGASDK